MNVTIHTLTNINTTDNNSDSGVDEVWYMKMAEIMLYLTCCSRQRYLFYTTDSVNNKEVNSDNKYNFAYNTEKDNNMNWLVVVFSCTDNYAVDLLYAVIFKMRIIISIVTFTKKLQLLKEKVGAIRSKVFGMV